MAPYPAEISGNSASAEITRRHPLLHYKFMLGDWQKVVDEVLSGRVELGLADVSAAEDSDRLVTEVVGRHPFLFYCRRGHPLAGFADVSKAQIDGYPLVAIQVPPRLAGSFPGGGRIDRSTGSLVPSIEIEDLASARAIVATSDAVSGGAPAQIQALVSSGKFVALPFRQASLKFNYGFIYQKDQMLSPAAELFMQLVRDIEGRLATEIPQMMRKLFPD